MLAGGRWHSSLRKRAHLGFRAQRTSISTPAPTRRVVSQLLLLLPFPNWLFLSQFNQLIPTGDQPLRAINHHWRREEFPSVVSQYQKSLPVKGSVSPCQAAPIQFDRLPNQQACLAQVPQIGLTCERERFDLRIELHKPSLYSCQQCGNEFERRISKLNNDNNPT